MPGGTSPRDQCLQLAMAVVDRVQTRLQGLPAHVLEAPLPDPATALTFRLERRTANTLRRALDEGAEGPWTLARYLQLPRFGGRAVVDLLAAAEAHGGGANAKEIVAERISDRALTIIARQLPISEKRVNEDLAACGAPTAFRPPGSRPFDGRSRPDRALPCAGDWRRSHRAPAVAAERGARRLRRGRPVDPELGSDDHCLRRRPPRARSRLGEQRVLRRAGAGRPARLSVDRSEQRLVLVRRPFESPARRPAEDPVRDLRDCPVARLWSALFHVRPGGAPAPETLGRICAEIPGARIAAGELVFDGRLERSVHLTQPENRLVTILEAAGGSLPLAQLRRAIQAMGLSWTPASHSVRTSPLFTTSDGRNLVRLL